MSLINDALKKAQRQREAAAPPVATATTPVEGSNVARIAKRRQPLPARTLILLVTGAILLSVTAGVFGLILHHLKTVQPAPVLLAKVHRPAPPPPAPITVSMPPAKPIAPPTPPPETVKLVAPAAPVVVIPAAPVVVEPPVPAAPAANPAANLFLDAARITGVRSAGADSKVILNDRVVRIGDIVDPSTGLRLVKVDASALVFTDANGFPYEKDLP